MPHPVQTWTKDGSDHYLSQQARHARMNEPLTRRLLDAARIGDTDRVLDIGCGCGDTTRGAARRARNGHVLGIDVSPELLAEARRLSAAQTESGTMELRHADAQTHPLVGFDAAISSFGLMFFTDPHAAFVNIRAGLRPGGRLAFLCWQTADSNEFFTVPFQAMTAVTGPPDRAAAGRQAAFSLADPQRTQALLAGAGFHDVDIVSVTEPLYLGDDPVDVAGYYCDTPAARALLAYADTVTRAAVRDSLTAALTARQQPTGRIELGSATWLVTAHH